MVNDSLITYFFLSSKTLLSFLNPGANRLRTQIMEVLDMDLIRQQAANNAVDIKGLVSYIINTMGKFCAPVRDDEIKKLKENSGDVVKLFKYVQGVFLYAFAELGKFPFRAYWLV